MQIKSVSQSGDFMDALSNLMPGVVEFKPDGTGLRVALVVCRFNSGLSEAIASEAVGRLRRHGVAEEAMTIIMSPSAVAMLPIVRRALASPGYDAVMVLGAVIQDGDTESMIDASVIGNGLNHIIRYAEKPVGIGMLFSESLEQALSEVGRPDGIGESAAVSILEQYHAGRQLSDVGNTGADTNASAAPARDGSP